MPQASDFGARFLGGAASSNESKMHPTSHTRCGDERMPRHSACQTADELQAKMATTMIRSSSPAHAASRTSSVEDRTAWSDDGFDVVCDASYANCDDVSSVSSESPLSTTDFAYRGKHSDETITPRRTNSPTTSCNKMYPRSSRLTLSATCAVALQRPRSLAFAQHHGQAAAASCESDTDVDEVSAANPVPTAGGFAQPLGSKPASASSKPAVFTHADGRPLKPCLKQNIVWNVHSDSSGDEQTMTRHMARNRTSPMTMHGPLPASSSATRDASHVPPTKKENQEIAATQRKQAT